MNWKNTDWKRLQRQIQRLQRRIYQASKSGNKTKVHFLQKKLIDSPYAKLISVRRVTTENKGKRTPGLDQKVYLTPSKKYKLAKILQIDGRAAPIRRVWIPKPGRVEKRPLGIPTIQDRAKQMIVLMALEPEWEAKFEPNSYGFRPGRSCQDAMEAIFLTHRKTPNKTSDQRFIIDADLKGCFDNINHTYLLKKLNTFPAIYLQIKAWLKAGIFEGMVLSPDNYSQIAPNISGTPQGGIISPLLCNIALHGIENNIKKWVQKQTWPSHRKLYKRDKRDSILLVRYADDFIISHPNREVALAAKDETARWLMETSQLRFNEDKTLIKSIKEGFNFLGFTFIRVFNKNVGLYRLKIYPTKKNQKSVIDRIGDICRKNRAISAYDLTRRLSPIILGWANYYRYCECKDTFNKMDHFTFRVLRAWVFRRARTKGRISIRQKYFPSGNTYIFDGRRYFDNWILVGKGRIKGNKVDEKQLPKFGWVQSKKYVKVRGDASIYDGNSIYWTLRLINHFAFNTRIRKLLRRQKGICPLCKEKFDYFSDMEVDHIIPRKKGGKDAYSNLQLLHKQCHIKKTNTEIY